MNAMKTQDAGLDELRKQLKALSNRYAVDILRVLNPATGEMIEGMSWDYIFDGILELSGVQKPKSVKTGEKTSSQAEYQKKRTSLVSGGTIYETMNKLIRANYVTASGSRGKKNREFMITQQGRQALAAIGGMLGPTSADTDVQKAAKILLKYKNYISLMPAQEKFVREISSVDGNLIIQMPPGSGKTFLAMIIILLKLQEGGRCLYLTPYTSLNRQIIDDYKELLSELSFSVIRHDGQHRAAIEELEEANMVVSVFESFLSAHIRGRKWAANFDLIIIDELTALESTGQIRQARNLGTDRSTKLDCAIAMIKDKSQIVTLSSRFGDTEIVANWLDATVFRPSFRLRPDEYIVKMDNGVVDIFSSDGTQNTSRNAETTTDAILEHIGDETKSILFVVGSRFEAEMLAKRIGEEYPVHMSEEVVTNIIGHEEHLPATKRLKELLPNGTAFHHSGLSQKVRERLENSIRQGLVRRVVSTTGITAGMSFPFDCVVIYFDYTLYYVAARARYLQIAGRIGEYHLSRYGGSVYLVYLEARQFRNVEDMEDILLHKPLEPLYPGVFYPILVANLIASIASGKTSVTKQQLQTEFNKLVQGTLRHEMDNEFEKMNNSMFKILFDWAVKNNVLVKKDTKYALSKEGKAAVKSGINIIDYVNVKNTLDSLGHNASDEELIDLVMNFEVPQSVRPRSSMPTAIEIKASELEPPDDWYKELATQRREVKKQVLASWINEQEMTMVLDDAQKLAESIQVGGKPMGGVDLDEGDLQYFIEICVNLALDLSLLYESVRKKSLAKRLYQFSRQVQFGVQADLADSDLLDLEVVVDKELPPKKLSRKEVRILYDNGYRTANDVVRKEIDPDKEGLARDRFADKSGLDVKHAKAIYRASLQFLHDQ
jgi:replicative superfamily II helicase